MPQEPKKCIFICVGIYGRGKTEPIYFLYMQTEETRSIYAICIKCAAAICLPSGVAIIFIGRVWCCCFVIWLLKYLQGIELIHLFYSAHPYIHSACAYPFPGIVSFIVSRFSQSTLYYALYILASATTTCTEKIWFYTYECVWVSF